MDLPGREYWKQWVNFVREAMLSRGYINGNEFSFFRIVTDIDAALYEIKSFYRNFHSYRFVKQHLVIRLNQPPSSGLIDNLNRSFADILTEGKITHTESLSEESDDPRTLHLHRLLVPFNRKDFARLRQMMDVINRED
jgi:hypothetical protein